MSIDRRYKTTNKLDTDFRAETIAAGLIEGGQDSDRILIVRNKGDKRNVSKDIAYIDKNFSQIDLMEYLYIYTNRNSIYDAIPENVFHQPLNTARKKTTEDIIKEIRSHRQEEFYARKFFQPFEMAIDQLLIDAQLYERKFDKKNFYDNLKNMLSSYWPVLRLLTLKQALFFIRVLPVIHQIAVDFEIIANIMGVILEVPVNIGLGKQSEIKTTISKRINRNKWKLGINTVLGDTFRDGHRDIEITIGPTTPDLVKSFWQGYKNNQILKQLISMMLPANIQRSVKFKVLDEFAKFRLSGATHKAYLGINTRL